MWLLLNFNMLVDKYDLFNQKQCSFMFTNLRIIDIEHNLSSTNLLMRYKHVITEAIKLFYVLSACGVFSCFSWGK